MFCQTGLAAARGPDEGRDLSRLNRETDVVEGQLIGTISERHAVEGNRALEARRLTRVSPIAHAAFHFEDFAYPLEADAGFRHRVGRLRQIPHRLVHLPQVQQKDDERAGGQLSRDDQPRTVPQHQAGAGRHDDVDDRGQLHLDVPRSQGGFDVLEALALEALLFVFLARECLDDPDRREDLGDNRHELALLLADIA